MREIWFADNRDLIKWGVLVWLARKHKLQTIVQIPYWPREAPDRRPHFCFHNDQRSAPEDVPDLVWRFFRDLKSAEALGKEVGISVKVIDQVCNHTERDTYVSEAIARDFQNCKRPLVLFLDPDTGLEPRKAKDTHTTEAEVKHAWTELVQKDDWLVLYQHKWRRESLEKTVEGITQRLKEICRGALVEAAWSDQQGMKDVALLCLGPKP